MASYKILIKKSAQRELKKLPRSVRGKAVQKINSLHINPIPVDAEKIKGLDDAYRIRQGVYRILYFVYKRELVVAVVRIRHRKDVYRNL